jgi:hypothetical protein
LNDAAAPGKVLLHQISTCDVHIYRVPYASSIETK